MTYTPRTDWVDEPAHTTPILAADLIRIEQGIAAVETETLAAAGSAQTAATTAAGTYTDEQIAAEVSRADTAYGAATIRRGSIIPVGSLDVTQAALTATNTALVEFSFFGDSTTSGAAADGQEYSWVDQVKARCIAAGIRFGGHGMFHPADYAFGYTFPSTEQPTVTASNPNNTNAWTGGNSTCPIGWNSITAGESITFSFTGTQLRLMISYANVGARMSYSIDGGTAVTVETLIPVGGVNPYITKPTLITGLASGTHTLTVTNVQAATILDPAVTQQGSASNGGSLTNGTTYFYWLTATSASGESAPKACGTVTATSTNKTAGGMQFVPGFGVTGGKLYRSTTNNPTTAGLVKTTSGSVGATLNLSDDGTVSPTTAPPTSNTLGLFAAAHTVSFYPEFLHDSGLVCHRDALNGSTTTTFFDITPAAASIGDSPVKMGLVNINDGAPVSGLPWGLPQGTRPLNRNTKLVVIQLGTNDISSNPSGMDLTGTQVTTYVEQTAYAVRTARAAGCDVVLIAPPYTAAVATEARYSGRYKLELQALAQSYGVVYLDFQEALGYDTKNWLGRGYGPGQESAPHLPKVAYQAEGDFFFDRIIAPLL